MSEEREWVTQARELIAGGTSVKEAARRLRRSEHSVRYALDINGARQKHRLQNRASQAKERAERTGVRPKAMGCRSPVLVREDEAVARAYADPKPLRPLTLPKISISDLDEPVLIRFAPKTRAEPDGVERIRHIHQRMIRLGKIPAPDLLGAFNA